MQVVMLHAQFGGTSTKKDLETRFLKTKTLVVKTGDDHFDQNLEAGFKKTLSGFPVAFFLLVLVKTCEMH